MRVSDEMLDAGERAVAPLVRDGVEPRKVAEICWREMGKVRETLGRAPLPRGRPPLREADQLAAVEALKNGESVNSVRRRWNFSGSIMAKLKKQVVL